MTINSLKSNFLITPKKYNSQKNKLPNFLPMAIKLTRWELLKIQRKRNPKNQKAIYS